MSTLDKIVNKPSADPFDQLVFEKGLRAKHILFDKELDLLLVVLNNAKVLKLKLSDYPKLYHATETQLQDWKLVGGGVAVEWEQVGEDLSVKGFIKTAALNAISGSVDNGDERIVA
jgi:hypothetical protein